MTSPFILTAVVIFWICGLADSSSGANYNFTYHRTKMTWHKAADTCEKEGKRLLTMNNLEKLNFLNQDPIKSTIFSVELWIGLKALDKSCNLYNWHLSNALFNWSNWASGEPDYCETEECIRIVQSKWRTRTCDRYYAFICENVINFDNGQSTISSQTDGAEGTTTNTPEVTETPIADSISTEVSTFNVIDEDQSTTLYNDKISTQPIVQNGTNTVTGETVSLVGTSIDSEQTTTQVITTEGGQIERTTAILTPTYCVEECREYRQHGCPPVLWDSDSPVDDALRLVIENLKDELRVLKTETQLYIRGKTSVYERRSSAEAIGSMGIIVMVAFCGFVVFLDLPKLLKYFRSHINAKYAR